MVSNRVKGHINTLATETMKIKSYLKFKLKLRSAFEEKVKQVNEANL